MSESNLPDLWPYSIRASALLKNWKGEVWDMHAVFPDLREVIWFYRCIGADRINSLIVSCGALPPPHQEVVFEWDRQSSPVGLGVALRYFEAGIANEPDRRKEGKLRGTVVCKNCSMSLGKEFLELNGMDILPAGYAERCIRCTPLRSFFKF